jgi:tetratricopeptide (TPR) repeat protein
MCGSLNNLPLLKISGFWLVKRKEDILTMLEQEPKDIFLNYALAMEWLGEGNYNKAEEQFLKTLQIKQDYLPCFYQLGQTAEKLNKEKEALEYYKKGVDLAKQQNNTKALNELNEAIWLLEE